MPNWRLRRASRAGGRQVVDPPPLEVDLALVRGVQRAQQVQQRALARTALAHDRQEFPVPDAHAEAAEHGHGHRALAVALVQVRWPPCADRGGCRPRSASARRLRGPYWRQRWKKGRLPAAVSRCYS